jgi:hypothetical protein
LVHAQTPGTDAGPDACAENSYAFVTFILKPRNCCPRIENRLAHRLNGASDICTDEVVGAFNFGRLTLLMIGKRESQRRHSNHIENPASLDVTFRLGIPLRQHDNCIARFFPVLVLGERILLAPGYFVDGVCTDLSTLTGHRQVDSP